MFKHRHIIAIFSLALMVYSLCAPIGHALTGDAHHNHTTCSVCLLDYNLHCADVSTTDLPPLPEKMDTNEREVIVQSFIPAFHYAVAHPRGPPV